MSGVCRMAWGRKKSGGRKEPLFGLPAALADLRLSPEDRIPAAADDDKPKKSVPKRKPEEDDDEPPPRERKPRAAKAAPSGARNRAAEFRFGRLFYWGAVLGLWAAIAVVGVVVWVGAHLPAIQSLEIPKRPPTIQIVGIDGSVLAHARRNGRRQCRAEGSAALSAEGVHRHRGPPLLFALRRRSRRHRARRGRQRAASRRLAGRLDADPAARQEPVPDPGAHHRAQAAGSRSWRSGWSASIPRTRFSSSISTASISAPAPMASRRRRSAISASPRKNVTVAEAAMLAGLVKSPSRLAPNRNPEGAEAARADRARGDGGRQLHHRRPGARPRSAIPPTM